MAAMAKTRTQTSANVGQQAPVGIWTPASLMSALRSGSMEDKIDALKAAGIVDARGKLGRRYKNWGTKVTRTPDAGDL